MISSYVISSIFSRSLASTLLLSALVLPMSALAAGTAKKESKATATTPEKKDEKQKASGDKKMTTVIIETSLGNIEAEINAEKAPVSAANFLKYVDKKHYDGLIFHRVISGFMIQGGGMDENMQEKKNDAPIKNEATNGLKNDRGTLAMARTGVVDSATSQFFINTVDNGFLNHSSPDPRGYGYAVFGKVTSGMDIVDKIRAVQTGTKNGMADVPNTPVVIKTIKRK
ncbi:hypothetical protein BH10BDE1_BH10BDE1_11200 [soil metagenome]